MKNWIEKNVKSSKTFEWKNQQGIARKSLQTFLV